MRQYEVRAHLRLRMIESRKRYKRRILHLLHPCDDSIIPAMISSGNHSREDVEPAAQLKEALGVKVEKWSPLHEYLGILP